MKNALRLTVLLCSLLVTAGWAQEKKLTIKNADVPVVSLHEKQAQALGNMPAVPAAAGIMPNFRYAVRNALPGVVHILCTYKPGIRNDFDMKLHSGDLWNSSGQTDGSLLVGSASGVLLSPDGYIVTNYHVVKDTRSLDAVLYDHRIYHANLVGMDSAFDLAVLKIEEKGLPFVKLGSTDSLEEGDWVLTIGNPLSLPYTVTAGIVSARARYIPTPDGKPGNCAFIQTDAVTNDGSSGGALVNTRGELVGLSTGIFTRTGHYDGYSFSIPVTLITQVCNELIRKGAPHNTARRGDGIF